MLCTGRSGPNWLDRLRSSKGFPVGNGIDLEHFLNPNPKNDSILEKEDRESNNDSVAMEEKEVVERKKTMTYSKDQKNCEKEDLFDIMSSVLSELFNMEDSGKFQEIRDFDKKKSSRKQKNPKVCVFSAVDDYVPAISLCSADNGVREEKELGSGLQPKKTVEDEKLKKAERSGYSRADVMIIDTSAPIWKTEKLIFRKGNVWKVWEKKSKCGKVVGSRKKRKSNELSDSEDAGKKKMRKKRKVSVSPAAAAAAAEAGQEKAVVLPNEGSPQNDREKAWKRTLHHLSQVPGNRLWPSRSPRKPAKKGSSVFHVQRIPSSRKNGDQLPNTSTKGMH